MTIINSVWIPLLVIGLTMTSGPARSLTQTEHSPQTATTYSLEIEQLLNQVFAEVSQQRLLEASTIAETLVRRFPKFLLGQLLHAEFSAMQGMSNTLIDSDDYFSPQLLELLMEAQSRVPRHPVTLNDKELPDNLLQLGTDVDHIVAVDLEHSRLYLIDNLGVQPRIVSQHYAGSGRGGYGKLVEGDLRTPTGIYQVTQFRPDRTLPALYGSGALTLDYPNAVDRIYRRTGYGIWLHGIPANSLSRGPRSSEGCVVMPNDLLTQLHQSVNPSRTLVLLSGELQWVDQTTLTTDKSTYLSLFHQFQQAWLQNTDDGLSAAYEPELFQVPVATRIKAKPQHYDLEGIGELDPSQVTMLRYPAFPGIVADNQLMMRFTLSTVIGRERRITLYWEQRADEKWQIMHINEEKDPV